MARSQASDFLQNSKFWVQSVEKYLEYEDSENGAAGFQSVTLPEMNSEAVEYKEGHYTYTQKYPGAVTVGDVSLMRGHSKKDSKFYDWMMRVKDGEEYRTTLIIYRWHRDGKAKNKGIGDLAKAEKTICYEAFPTRMKPGADLDASSSEVSISELDVAIEYFEVERAT